jgi:uncharacterized protein YkwD
VRTSRRLRIAAACALSSVAAFVATTAPAEASRGDCVPEAGWPAQSTTLATQVVQLVNAYRAGQGLSTLSVSQSLTNAAAWKAGQLSADVATAGAAAFDHSDYGTGRTPQVRLQACGYGAGFGENIALGQPSPDAVMRAWLASPGHKANLDYPAWTAIGVGAAAGGAGIGWVQDFGVSNPDPASTSAPSLVGPAATTPTPATPLAPALVSAFVQTPAPAPAPAAPAAAAADAPDVRVARRPRSRTHRRTARIRWSIAGVAHRVACSLNGRRLRRCGYTGRTLRHVGSGRHVFRITVTGPAGTDSAQIRWRVMS